MRCSCSGRPPPTGGGLIATACGVRRAAGDGRVDERLLSSARTIRRARERRVQVVRNEALDSSSDPV